MDNLFVYFLYSLVGDAPVLLAYLVGIALSLALWRRCPRAAMLTLIAMSLLMATAVTESFLSGYLGRAMRNWEIRQQTQVWGVISIVSNLIRAGATGLLLVAVFAGRKAAPRSF